MRMPRVRHADFVGVGKAQRDARIDSIFILNDLTYSPRVSGGLLYAQQQPFQLFVMITSVAVCHYFILIRFFYNS
jgi:hypothetical protein